MPHVYLMHVRTRVYSSYTSRILYCSGVMSVVQQSKKHLHLAFANVLSLIRVTTRALTLFRIMS